MKSCLSVENPDESSEKVHGYTMQTSDKNTSKNQDKLDLKFPENKSENSIHKNTSIFNNKQLTLNSSDAIAFESENFGEIKNEIKEEIKIETL